VIAGADRFRSGDAIRILNYGGYNQCVGGMPSGSDDGYAPVADAMCSRG
jgi:hypothetical protein